MIKLKTLFLAMAILLASSAVWAQQHAIKILDAWEHQDTLNGNRVHVKASIDGNIVQTWYPASDITDKATLLSLLDKDADNLLARYSRKKTAYPKHRPDLFDWEPEGDLSPRAVKSIIAVIINEINAVRAAQGLNPIQLKDIKQKIKNRLDQ